jgi:predicted MFS family arabinose efflux permease
MAALGVANAACQVTANLTLSRAVPPNRRGLGFGVKQSAIPLSIMLAGLAVPTIGAVVGWRWTFVCTGLGGLAVTLAGLRISRDTADPAEKLGGHDRPALSALITITVAITLASAAANSLASFIASWAFQVGLTPSHAGLLMAAGSAMNIVGRVVAGHLADRRHGRNMPVIATQMLIGAISLAALAVPSPWALIPAALVAFAFGWSWPGLVLYAVVRVGRDSPAAASGFVQAGAFVGGAAGPAVFGGVVGINGYQTAWLVAAALFLLAAILVMIARRMFISDLVARPPQVSLGYGGGRGAPARTTAPTRSGKEPRSSRRSCAPAPSHFTGTAILGLTRFDGHPR